MHVTALYFSPTGTTKKIVEHLSTAFSTRLFAESAHMTVDFTLKQDRVAAPTFTKDAFVVIGVPVYAGRVPNVLLEYLKSIQGNGARALCVVVYGNRNYDDALIELRDLLEADGFQVLGAGAFVGEHSFSRILAKGRPDVEDFANVDRFADAVSEKWKQLKTGTFDIPGYQPYRPYYRPKDKEGNPVDIRKVTPKTTDACTECGLCVRICPMESIDATNPRTLIGICIKCGACIKGCPVEAKYYDDPDYLRHQWELEEELITRKEPEWFL